MARSSDDVGDRALSFWEAHRALASAYETDLAQLQDQKVQLQIPRQASTSLLDLDACLRRDSSALRGGATPPSASMSMSPSVQRTSIRRNSFEECSVSARPSLMSMMLDGFLVEEQKARALGLQIRQRLEPRAGAESSLKLMHALSHHSDSQSEEMEDCLEPRICWQQDVSFPPRKLSATATASIAVPEKSQRVWMLSPASRARVRWDLLAVLMVLVELLVFPAQVFSDTWPQQVWPEFALLSLTFWSCDISLNFLTGFHSGGELVLNASDIAKKYLRGWFFFDLLFVASDLAALCAGLGSAPRELWVALRSAQLVLRLGRLMQLGKMTECLKRRLVNDVSIAKLDIGLIVMQIFTTQHLVACAWYDLGIMNERGWVTHWQLQGRSKEFQYLTALHWTYCQLGFGGTEIEPSTAAERIFGLLVAFMALGIFSTLLGSVTGLSGLLNKSSEEKRFLFVTLRRFLEHNRIHEDLKERITCFLEHAYSLNKKNMTEDQVQLLELLSVPLHRELQRARYDFSLKELGLLRNSLGREARLQLIQRLASRAVTQQKFPASDLVWEPGAVASEAVFLMSGSLKYSLGVDWSITSQRWLAEMCLWTPWSYVGEMATQATTNLVKLNARQFFEALRDLHELRGAQSYAQEYVSAMNNFAAVTDLWEGPMDIVDPTMSGSLRGQQLLREKARGMFQWLQPLRWSKVVPTTP